MCTHVHYPAVAVLSSTRSARGLSSRCPSGKPAISEPCKPAERAMGGSKRVEVTVAIAFGGCELHLDHVVRHHHDSFGLPASFQNPRVVASSGGRRCRRQLRAIVPGHPVSGSVADLARVPLESGQVLEWIASGELARVDQAQVPFSHRRTMTGLKEVCAHHGHPCSP
jgi:hypothetical protein